ncbi:MAG: cyclic nucleotide-binding domain-containing protein [Rhodospirillaceae bacterium]|nr:cyclic nucleotide-binding domain-containing protein [Rhodospirillaceae bacterium]
MVADSDEKSIEVLNFPKGTHLFKQGDAGNADYVVNTGAIGLFREAHGRKIPLATVRRGEVFGELSAIDASPRMATAFTLEDANVMVIPVEIMADKLRKADPLIGTIAAMMMQTLRGVHETYLPKSRSLADAITQLGRQSEIVERFLQSDLPAAFRSDLSAKLEKLNKVIGELRGVAAAHRGEERRA